MNLLFKAALEIQNFMKKQDWTFCIIGGLANIRWGEIRMTQDIDISLLTEFGDEKKYIEILLNAFKSRISNGEKFALKNRVLLIKTSNKV